MLAPTAILPAKKCSKSHPRPRALRISPHLLICRPFFTSRLPPVSAPGLPPPAPRLLPRSHRDTPREKVLQIATAPACTPHIPAPAHLPPAFIPMHSPAPTAILPVKKCSKSPPRPRALRISPRPLICQLLSFPCTPPHPRPRALRISPHLLIHRPFFTSRLSPVSAPGFPLPAPRPLPRSYRDTPREKVLQIACPRRGYGVECLLLRRHSSVG